MLRNFLSPRQIALSTCVFLYLTGLAAGQGADPPGQMLEAYRAQRTIWFTSVFPAANTLFGLLALIDFAWSAAVMVLEKQDFQSWVSALVRKMMTIGAFYALLIYGRIWIPAIVDSFEILGQNAAASGPLNPGDVFTRGLNLSAALLGGASTAGLFTNFGGALALVFAAAMCLLAYCAITIQFVVAIVESYILVAAAFIYLGFGGSRWSQPYVERYIALAVSVGVKILLLYLLIGTGMTVSIFWLDDAESIGTAALPATAAFSIMGASLIFAALCWQVPKLIVGVLGGSPSLTGSDLISTIGTMAAGVALLGSGAAVAGGRLAAGGRGVLSMAGAAGGGGGGSVAAGFAPGSGASAAGPRSESGGLRAQETRQPPPPATRANSAGGSDTRVPPPK